MSTPDLMRGARVRRWCRYLTICCGLLAPSLAHAAGFELAPPGARDLGRAGASVVGSDSALGALYNPATGLANSSLYEAEAALHINLADSCFTRTEVSESNGEQQAGDKLPKVCSQGPIALIPQIALAARFGSKHRFAVMLTLGAPVSGSRNDRYGARDAQADSPARYSVLHQNMLQLFPGLSVAYEPHPRVRMGAGFAWGITTFDFALTTFSRTVVLPPNTGALSDSATRIAATDAFTPRVQLGVWSAPVPRVPLELGLAFTWTQDVRVADTTLELNGLRTTYYPGSLLGPSGLLGNPPQPEIHAKVQDVSVRVPMTSTLAAGLRYAHKLGVPVGTIGDRLGTERFDLELDVVATFGKRVDSIDIDLPPTTLNVPSPSPLVRDIALQLPETIRLQQRWTNAWSLRLGGDVTVLPNRLALRAGLTYESHGVRHGYEQLNFAPWERFGLHAGVTWRIVRWIDISAGYAHFITPDVSVSASDARWRRVIAGQTQAGDDAVVNAGRYTYQAGAFALQLSGRI